MPEYRFRIKDSDGKIRAGKTLAPSKDDARRRIEDAGFVVLELFENIDVAASVKIQEGGGSYTGANYRSLRVEPLQLDPLWSDRISAWVPRGQAANKVLLGLVVVGLGWGLWQVKSADSARKPTVEATQTMVNVTADVQVVLPAGAVLSDLKLVVSFPEIPYQSGKAWNDLDHPSKDHAVFKLNFLTSVVPKNCVVIAKLGSGREITSQSLPVKDGKGNLQVKLSLPKT
jgi:hypothetical protein